MGGARARAGCRLGPLRLTFMVTRKQKMNARTKMHGQDAVQGRRRVRGKSSQVKYRYTVLFGVTRGDDPLSIHAPIRGLMDLDLVKSLLT